MTWILITVVLIIILVFIFIMAFCLLNNNSPYDQRIKDQEQLNFLSKYEQKQNSKNTNKESVKDEKHA